MKRVMAIFLGILMVFSVSTAFAIDVVPQEGERQKATVPTELTEEPDPRAIQVGMPNPNVEASFKEWEDGVMDPEVFYSYMENNEFIDDGTVWVSWSNKGSSKYGCTTASIRFTNPSNSNIGVTLKVALFDSELLSNFGTTFREEEELMELALSGYEALKTGIHVSVAENLIKINELFDGMTAEELCVKASELPKLLASKGFLEMSEEEIKGIDEEKIEKMTEIEKLTLAELGGYDPNAWYMEIAKAGVIKPGFSLREIDLHTLPGQICLPKGTYNAVFVLNGFDAWKSELSDFFIHLPLTLKIKEDLTEELQEEYGVTLAEKIK